MLSVKAFAAPAPAYQWQLNGTNVARGTNSTLGFNTWRTNAGSYRVTVSNYLGSVTSDDAVVIALPQMDEPQVDGKNLILSWLDPFMLQTSTNDATGPYHDLVGATSPFSKPNDCSAAGLGTICGTISR